VKNKGQISFEYLVLMGFVTLVISTLLGISLFYTNGIQDQLRITQATKFANKIVSTAEYVFYAGEPSKATITVYLPENVEEIEIAENSLILTILTSSGDNVVQFPSEVNITENPTAEIVAAKGLKKIEIVAQSNAVLIGAA